jgi:hypothetical protein
MISMLDELVPLFFIRLNNEDSENTATRRTLSIFKWWTCLTIHKTANTTNFIYPEDF